MKFKFHPMLLVLGIAGCSCVKTKLPLHGKLGPYTLETTVDSPYAKYYVENYLANNGTDLKLNGRFDSLNKEFIGKTLDRENLNKISNVFSVDFASLFWAHQLLSMPENESVQIRFVRQLDSVEKNEVSILSHDYVILLVPGLDYKSNGNLTGADLKAQIEVLKKYGMNVHFIEIPPLGSVQENAKMIADTVKGYSNQKILIAGPSSAGPAIHFALSSQLSEKESLPVLAWVNLGGVVNGSPVLDWVDSGFTKPLWKIFLWSKNWKDDAYKSLRADVSRKRFANLKVPGHIKVINYIGLSLSGNISKFAMDKYCIMRSQGPNDGLGLLPDMVVPNSISIIAPTSDHFFAEDPLIKEKTVALLKTTIELL
jgi:hypothetical protein